MKSNSTIQKIKSAALKKWGDEVVSIVIYGSFVRGGKYRDVDVFIVLEKIDKGRIERIKDITEIKRALNFPADILLVSKEECRDNFKSHNPLFLDIASEGRLIYDRCLLEKLINEIKLEIQKNKIRKEFSRWEFPVKDRIPTPLSEITNKDWAMWKKQSKLCLYALASMRKTHYVASILRKEIKKRDLKEYAEKLNEATAIAEELELHVSLSRYPGISGGAVWLPSKEYTREIAEKSLKSAKRAFKAGEGFVKW